MRTTRRILAVCMLVLGGLLITYGVAGGLWPLSVQLIAGCLLVAFGALRLRYF